MKAVNSLEFLQPLWWCWKFLGVYSENIKFKKCYMAYSAIIHLLVTVCYPLHLGGMMFDNASVSNIFKNLSVFVTCAACSTKFIIYAMNLQSVRKIEDILKNLDARAIRADERAHFEQIRGRIRKIRYLFVGLYCAIGATAEISFLFRVERGLMYPAWFPFDWQHSKHNFYIANVYQFAGISLSILENYVNDTLPPIMLCLLSGHIKMLGLRVTRIGHTNENQLENEIELKRCIIDHKNLYRLFEAVQELISLPMLIQFAITATNFCATMVVLMFYVDAPMERVYYCTYFLSIPLQIFPTCYYGSHFQLLFQQLQRDVFYSNWIYQNYNFRKHVITFTERSLKEVTAKASNFVPINLETFISIAKGSYSLLTLIINFKSN